MQMLRRYFRSMGGCIGFHNRGQRGSDASEDNVHVSHNRPLKHRKPKWKSNIRLTEAQLQAKREEFWDTAPAFEGRREIWDALKASVAALEAGDFQMAQVILDGANISLPNGTLMDCYDELGNRYQLPVYILSAPINLIKKDEEKLENGVWGEDDENSSGGGAASVSHKKHCIETCGNKKSSSVKKEHLEQHSGKEMNIRIRFATGDDQRLVVNTNDTIAAVKMALARARPDINPSCIRFFFSGKQLNNKITLAKAKIESNYTIQAIISEPSPSLPIEKSQEPSGRKSSSSKKRSKSLSNVAHANIHANLRVGDGVDNMVVMVSDVQTNNVVTIGDNNININNNNIIIKNNNVNGAVNNEVVVLDNDCDKSDTTTVFKNEIVPKKQIQQQQQHTPQQHTPQQHPAQQQQQHPPQQQKIFYNLSNSQEAHSMFTYDHDKQNTQLQQQQQQRYNNVAHVLATECNVQNCCKQQQNQQQQPQQSYYTSTQCSQQNFGLPTQQQQHPLQHHPPPYEQILEN